MGIWFPGAFLVAVGFPDPLAGQEEGRAGGPQLEHLRGAPWKIGRA